MSFALVSWALDKAPVTDATSVLILVALAEFADEDGSAFPSQETLAQRARCSERTVRRKLVELEELGLIERGNQAIIAAKRPDIPVKYRPVVWQLRPDNMTGHKSRADSMTGHGESSRADTAMSDKPPYTPTPKGVGETPTNAQARESEGDPLSNESLDAMFEQAWKHWCANGSKKHARLAFRRDARKFFRDDPGELVRRIITFGDAYRVHKASDRESRQYTPHLATWLNREGWDEMPQEPFAPPAAARPGGGERGRNILDMGANLIASRNDQRSLK